MLELMEEYLIDKFFYLSYMKDCIFCSIVRGEAECVKLWEDDGFMAILDINPNTKGCTLVIPKKHHDSYVFDMDDGVYQRFFLACREVSKMLEKGLGVKRVGMVFEGLGVNHAHIKLYPIHGLKDTFQELFSERTVYFDKYEGYLTTEMGPRKNYDELRKVAEEIKHNL